MSEPEWPVIVALGLIGGFVILAMVAIIRIKQDESRKALLLLLWSFFGPIIGVASTYFFTRTEVKQAQVQMKASEENAAKLGTQLEATQLRAQQAEQLIKAQDIALTEFVKVLSPYQLKTLHADAAVAAALDRLKESNNYK